MYSGHLFGLGGGIMWLFWLFIIVLVFYFIKDIVSDGEKTKLHQSQQPGQSTLEILKTRYAKGEINLVEFNKMKKNLQV